MLLFFGEGGRELNLGWFKEGGKSLKIGCLICESKKKWKEKNKWKERSNKGSLGLVVATIGYPFSF